MEISRANIFKSNRHATHISAIGHMCARATRYVYRIFACVHTNLNIRIVLWSSITYTPNSNSLLMLLLLLLLYRFVCVSVCVEHNLSYGSSTSSLFNLYYMYTARPQHFTFVHFHGHFYLVNILYVLIVRYINKLIT